MKGDTLVNKTAAYNIIQCQKIKENFFLDLDQEKLWINKTLILFIFRVPSYSLQIGDEGAPISNPAGNLVAPLFFSNGPLKQQQYQ